MSFMAPGVTSDGSSLSHWHPPPDVLDSTLQLGIAAFSESLKRINKLMGWDNDADIRRPPPPNRPGTARLP